MTDFYGRDLDPLALWYIHVCSFIIIAASLWQPVVSFPKVAVVERLQGILALGV